MLQLLRMEEQPPFLLVHCIRDPVPGDADRESISVLRHGVSLQGESWQKVVQLNFGGNIGIFSPP